MQKAFEESRNRMREKMRLKRIQEKKVKRAKVFKEIAIISAYNIHRR